MIIRSNKRFNFMGVFFALLFVLLASRIFYIQIVIRRMILGSVRKFSEIKKLRGSILTSDGSVIACSVRGTRVYKRRGRTFKRSEINFLKKSGILLPKDIKSKGRSLLSSFVPLAASRILKKHLASKLEFIPAQKRIFFSGKEYKPIIGFTNSDNVGGAGVEYYYNRFLEGGKPEIVEIDATGKLLISDDPEVLRAKGNDVVLTVDSKVQNFLYDEVSKIVGEMSAEKGYGIVMKPATGEIVGMCFVGPQGHIYLKNPVISDSFEPGSTFKIVTASAVLEEKLVKPDDKFFCENGSFQFSGITIRDHKPYKWLTVKEIVQYSSNIGMSKLAAILGRQKLYYYARAFGFGNYTGINLPGESRGMLKRIKKWSEITPYSMSFGQEISATPIQIIQAFSVIANDGILIAPRIVRFVRNPDGKPLRRTKVTQIRRVISRNTAERMKDFLRAVVESGTGVEAKIPGWNICGKTGTAQKFDRKLGKYSENKFFASFCGFFPEEDPQILIFIGVDEPQKQHYGGSVCGPAFNEVSRKIIDYYGIPPSQENSPVALNCAGGKMPPNRDNRL
ncbi:MAG: penicillin-binding protein 2 [Elusimicrobia bacterium]|nr:penicillin-binding protein 2 [Elusimicrobiota bacterium]